MSWLPLWISVKVAVVAAVIVIIIGVPLARLMARRSFPGKNIVEAIILLPMVLPPTVVGFGLLLLIGKNGPIGKFFALFGVNLVFTWKAAVLAAAIVSLPLLYQNVKGAFLQIDTRLEDVARTLGAKESRIFFGISLPLAKPGLIAGIVLAFARALGEFGATMMVAGNIPGLTQTIPLAIYFAVQAGDYRSALGLVIIITIFSFAVIVWSNWWIRREKY